MANTDITLMIGSDEFPNNDNDVYGLVETIARQTIRGIKTSNRLDDALFNYEVQNGKVIEEALIKKATKQAYNKTTPILSAKDPTIYVKYFNNWKPRQYQTTIRRDDIRAIIADKGTGIEEVVAEILDTLSQGSASDEFKDSRDLLLKAPVKDYAAIMGVTPASMKGVIYAARDMYNHLVSDNSDLTEVAYESAVPENDVRIAITDKLLNLIDVTELANIFNLSKEELFGRIVPIPVSDLAETYWYKIIAYDRKAMGKARRLYDYTQDIFGSTRFTNAYLTVEEAYFFNGLFKACALDVTDAATTDLAVITDANTSYTITYVLTGVTSTNDAATATKNSSYFTILDGELAATVEVLSGATDITSSVYNSTDHTIYIPQVKGNLTITASNTAGA